MSVKNLGTDWIDLILIDVVTLSTVVTNLMLLLPTNSAFLALNPIPPSPPFLI